MALKIDNALNQLTFREFSNKKIVVTNTALESFKLQCPRMYMPFGISCFQSEYGTPKYTVDFTLTGHDDESSFVHKFVTEFRKLEDKICDEVVAQSEAIFNGEKKTFSEVKAMFTSAIRGDGGGWPPKLKAKVEVTSDGEVFKTPIYDEHEKLLADEPMRGIYAKSSGRAVLELTSIWFFNGKIGGLWKTDQLVVFAPSEQKIFKEFAFKNV